MTDSAEQDALRARYFSKVLTGHMAYTLFRTDS